MPRPYLTLSEMSEMPPATGWQDDEAIKKLLAGRSMLPVEYAPQLPEPQLPYGLGGPAQLTGGRNPRTGQPYYEESPGYLDMPLEGLAEASGGLYGLSRGPLESRAGSLSQLIRGGMKAAAPMLPGAVAAAPIPMLGGLLAGSVASGVTEPGLESLGVAPGYAALGGDIAGLVAGSAGAAGAEPAWRSLPELLRDESGTFRLGPTGKALTEMQTAELTPAEQQKLYDLTRGSEELKEAVPYLMPIEARKMITTPENARTVDTLLRELPKAEQLSAMAKAGAPKRGWYRASAQAIHDLFGWDAPRFAALLASMSPQTSVESNLINALHVWEEWNAAGRPSDARAIRAAMGRAVQGGKGEGSILPAWLNNSTRVLSAPDEALQQTISGPKVNSFYHNLLDEVHHVTNDTWMANAFGVAQTLFSGGADDAMLARGDPGLGPGYYGTSARIRQGAEQAGMQPYEGQETIWSVAMLLYELAQKNRISPQEVLDRGLLTREALIGTPDFATLMQLSRYRAPLERSGYGEQLSRLQPFSFDTPVPDLTLAEQRYLDQTARTVGELMNLRGMESAASSVPVPGTGSAFAYEQPQYPAQVAGAFQDLQNRDVLQQSLGLPTIATRTAKTAQGGEITPGYFIGSQVPVTNAGTLPAPVQNRLLASAALRGAMTEAERPGYRVDIPAEGGPRAVMPRPDKMPADLLRTASAELPNLIFRESGDLINVEKLRGALTQKELTDVQGLLGTAKDVRTRGADNFIDYARDWAKKPGSGAVTRKLLSYIDGLSKRDQASLSNAVKAPAAELLRWAQRHKRREDVQNLLRSLSEGGIPAVRKALESKAALPGLIGAILLPSVLTSDSADVQSVPRELRGAPATNP